MCKIIVGEVSQGAFLLEDAVVHMWCVEGSATLAACIPFGCVLGPASSDIVRVASPAGRFPLARGCCVCRIAVTTGMLKAITVGMLKVITDVWFVIMVVGMRAVDSRPEIASCRDAVASSVRAPPQTSHRLALARS